MDRDGTTLDVSNQYLGIKERSLSEFGIWKTLSLSTTNEDGWILHRQQISAPSPAGAWTQLCTNIGVCSVENIHLWFIPPWEMCPSLIKSYACGLITLYRAGRGILVTLPPSSLRLELTRSCRGNRITNFYGTLMIIWKALWRYRELLAAISFDFQLCKYL